MLPAARDPKHIQFRAHRRVCDTIPVKNRFAAMRICSVTAVRIRTFPAVWTPADIVQFKMHQLTAVRTANFQYHPDSGSYAEQDTENTSRDTEHDSAAFCEGKSDAEKDKSRKQHRIADQPVHTGIFHFFKQLHTISPVLSAVAANTERGSEACGSPREYI